MQRRGAAVRASRPEEQFSALSAVPRACASGCCSSDHRGGGARISYDALRSHRTRAPAHDRTRPPMIPALESLQRLQAGNARFASNVRGLDSFLSQERRALLAKQQEPHAIILGCSDSRVPAEIVFDQGLGDLFVIRVAGNIVAPSQVGSVEYAAERYETRLVVVLGHTQCGAILATLEELRQPTENQSRNLRAIVDRVRPSVAGLLATGLREDPEALVK